LTGPVLVAAARRMVNFLQCHLTVIAMLDKAKELG